MAVASPPILSMVDKTAFVGDETRYLDGQFHALGSKTHSCDVYRADWAPGVKTRTTAPLGSRCPATGTRHLGLQQRPWRRKLGRSLRQGMTEGL